MRSRIILAFGIGLGLMIGCSTEDPPPKPPRTGGVIGKKTRDIGEFDPAAKREVSDSKVRVDDPILGPLQAYGPIVEQISKTHIEHAINLFHAEYDRYPKDHAEFMAEIIKKNDIALPVLPAQHKYQYDVDHHQLVVVKPTAAELQEAGQPK